MTEEKLFNPDGMKEVSGIGVAAITGAGMFFAIFSWILVTYSIVIGAALYLLSSGLLVLSLHLGRKSMSGGAFKTINKIIKIIMLALNTFIFIAGLSSHLIRLI